MTMRFKNVTFEYGGVKYAAEEMMVDVGRSEVWPVFPTENLSGTTQVNEPDYEAIAESMGWWRHTSYQAGPKCFTNGELNIAPNSNSKNGYWKFRENGKNRSLSAGTSDLAKAIAYAEENKKSLEPKFDLQEMVDRQLSNEI